MILILLFLPISCFSFFFPPSGGGCGCAPCAAAPTCVPPVCQPIQSCQPPVLVGMADPSCSDSHKKCKTTRKKRSVEILSEATYIVNQTVLSTKPFEKHRQRRDVSKEIERSDGNCNSDELREIIKKNIDRVTTIAKRRIQSAAETQLQGRFNVICSRGDFSYITSTELFCQHSVADVTCFVFKQLSDVVRARLA